MAIRADNSSRRQTAPVNCTQTTAQKYIIRNITRKSNCSEERTVYELTSTSSSIHCAPYFIFHKKKNTPWVQTSKRFANERSGGVFSLCARCQSCTWCRFVCDYLFDRLFSLFECLVIWLIPVLFLSPPLYLSGCGSSYFYFYNKKYSSFYCFCFTFQEVVVAMTNINCDDCDASDDHGNWDCDISWDLLAYVVYLGTCRDRIHALSW